MSDLLCRDVELSLSVGEADSPGRMRHLERCSSCRAFADGLKRIGRELAAEAAVPPPRHLDRAVRTALRAEIGAQGRADIIERRSLLLILAAAVISLAGFSSALHAALTEAGWGDSALPLTMIAMVTYLSAASAATIPLLFRVFRPVGSVPPRRAT